MIFSFCSTFIFSASPRSSSASPFFAPPLLRPAPISSSSPLSAPRVSASPSLLFRALLLFLFLFLLLLHFLLSSLCNSFFCSPFTPHSSISPFLLFLLIYFLLLLSLLFLVCYSCYSFCNFYYLSFNFLQIFLKLCPGILVSNCLLLI